MSNLTHGVQVASPFMSVTPSAGGAGVNGLGVSLKDCARAFVYFGITQAAANTIQLSVEQCTAVAGTGAKAISAAPIWSNLDTATDATWTARTAAATYTTDAAVKNKMVCFQIETASLDLAGGFDCIRAVVGSSAAANITCSFIFFADPRYAGAAASTVRTD